MTNQNPLVRCIILVLGAAIAIRVAWLLIEPELPVIFGVIAATAIWRAIKWYRSRW